MNKKWNFLNDYSQIAHPEILKTLQNYQSEVFAGYGLDYYSQKASGLIKKNFTRNVDIHFLIGGTSANKIVIASILKPYQAVISVDTGHINVHETGAIESTGHKIITVLGENGKITPAEIDKVMKTHIDEHMVMPKLVYLSNATELGTIYSKEELRDIYEMCKKWQLYLFIDGARLGVALTSTQNDLTLDDLSIYADVFYIGGTKNGLMMGEAVVICNDDLKQNFRYYIKQNGGMLAKGFLIGLQFARLFEDDLFFRLARHANLMAGKLKKGLLDLGIKLVNKSSTNQVFLSLDNNLIKELKKVCLFEEWAKSDENYTIIRFVTSWATTEEEVSEVLKWFKIKKVALA